MCCPGSANRPPLALRKVWRKQRRRKHHGGSRLQKFRIGTTGARGRIPTYAHTPRSRKVTYTQLPTYATKSACNIVSDFEDPPESTYCSGAAIYSLSITSKPGRKTARGPKTKKRTQHKWSIVSNVKGSRSASILLPSPQATSTNTGVLEGKESSPGNEAGTTPRERRAVRRAAILVATKRHWARSVRENQKIDQTA